MKEFIPEVKQIIIKNSKEELRFTSDIIENLKKINTSHLISKKSLKIAVQKISRTQEQLWIKHSKRVKIIKQSKD